MAEMLSMAGERGYSILVSVYEVCNEAVYDISDQEKRVVSVLESAQGRIQLKGLSKAKSLALSLKQCIIHILLVNVINVLKFVLSGTCEVTLRVQRIIFRSQENSEAEG